MEVVLGFFLTPLMSSWVTFQGNFYWCMMALTVVHQSPGAGRPSGGWGGFPIGRSVPSQRSRWSKCVLFLLFTRKNKSHQFYSHLSWVWGLVRLPPSPGSPAPLLQLWSRGDTKSSAMRHQSGPNWEQWSARWGNSGSHWRPRPPERESSLFRQFFILHAKGR